MAEHSRVVVNTSPLILLASAGHLPLLQAFADEVLVPQAVLNELAEGAGKVGVAEVDAVQWIRKLPSAPLPAEVQAFGLGAGEAAVLSVVLIDPTAVAIIDDAAARRAAARLGLPYTGTLAVIAVAKRDGVIAEARPVVQKLHDAGAYLSPRLIAAFLASVGE